MSYAGLLSYIYADLSKSDPRVTAAVDWLKGHYSVDENPGMGADGLFYYYQVMAKGSRAPMAAANWRWPMGASELAAGTGPETDRPPGRGWLVEKRERPLDGERTPCSPPPTRS